MLSTMQDVPLTVTRILRHGSTVHGTSQVITWTGDGAPQRRSFREIGERTAQLAHALRDDLGVTGDECVATFMWNRVPKTSGGSSPPDQGEQRTAPVPA